MAEQIAIPFRPEAQDLYAVFVPVERPVPSIPDLERTAAAWRDRHLQDPLKKFVDVFVSHHFGEVRVEAVESLPEIPIELLRHVGLGVREEQVIRSARHAVVVTSGDFNIYPRAGLWTALSAAIGIAESIDGVIFDPDALRIVDPGNAAEWFNPNGIVSASQHIIVPYSVGETGLGWMTTRGLQKFGLPELQLEDIPPHLQLLNLLMDAVAQLLIEEGIRLTNRVDLPSQLFFDRDVMVDRLTIGRALPDGPDDLAKDADIMVGLRFDDAGDDIPFVTIVRPQNMLMDHGEWLYSVMNRLVPIDDVPFMAETGNADMAAAHERAVSELPGIRDHFQSGLKPGEILMIKHGFGAPHGEPEYMWVTVTAWRDGMITGQLSNIPNDVSSLQLGQKVMIAESEVFDWVLMLGRDRRQGGYTDEVARREGRQW